jgi:predicted aminopeptidase
MMAYGDDELASIMFHELSHQLVYIPDDTSFNEAFAVTVEQEGLARWLKSRGREADLAKYQNRRVRQSEGVALVARFRGELRALYGIDIGAEVMRQRKAQVFARLVTELRALDARFGTTSGLAAELDGKPNNARLASLATYYDCVPGFERLLAGEQRDLPRFYDAARALAKLPREERQRRLCSSAPGSPQ